MTITVYVRALLAMVLVTSGAAKLADLDGFAHTLRVLRDSRPGMGRGTLPSRLWTGRRANRPVLARLVPIGELGLAAMVFTWRYTRVTNVLLVAAYVAFAMVTTYAVYRAPQASCRCFGGLAQKRFGRETLARNLLLLAAAVFVTVDEPGLAAPAWWWTLVALVVVTIFGFACATASRSLDLLRRPLPARQRLVYGDD